MKRWEIMGKTGNIWENPIKMGEIYENTRVSWRFLAGKIIYINETNINYKHVLNGKII
jgi:hypothetical protein